MTEKKTAVGETTFNNSSNLVSLLSQARQVAQSSTSLRQQILINLASPLSGNALKTTAATLT